MHQQSPEWVTGIINDFLNSSENTLQKWDDEKAWEEPLVGFSSGADPIFEAYKEHVGPFHFTPIELFNLTFPSLTVSPDQLTVISWILPQTKATKKDNRKETAFPAERWARARIMGEEVNVKLRKHVVTKLQEAGYEALAPQLSPHWGRNDSGRFGFASKWSERHAAYASGLGTFGLCDGLITPKGKAMRTGSVIANVQIPPTERPYTDHHEYCLFYTTGKCFKCAERCPADAISEDGKDKIKCLAYLKPGTHDYVEKNFHFKGYGCGLCQTAVPCESGIPARKES